jgi:hypothetical protein
MAQRNNANKKNSNNGANLGFEQKLWQAADKMRGHMDSAEYKHVVLGLIFLKYISDAFHERQEALKKEPNADPEDRDEYTAENVFWVPKKARWSNLQANAKQASIGKLIDDAMEEIEKANPSLKGVLPKDYNRPALDKHRLGELIDLIADIGLGDAENRSKDILGRVYEYFLSQFASAEGKKGGEFYTPRCIVKLLVEMIEPFKGRVYDPCCGSSGMFVQSEEFIKQHGGRLGDISIYGQESNPTTWKLAKMNLAIRGIEANLAQRASTIWIGPKGDRRVGVVWHTQGSGKSLTMAFYAGKIIQHPTMSNPTLVVLTDRNDLDDQLFGTFSACKDLLRQTPEQAESREHLQELLRCSGGGVIFTTIQKFLPEAKGHTVPPVSDRRNIVVIADEAHRSQYGFIEGFARHMRSALAGLVRARQRAAQDRSIRLSEVHA